jgi:hypothetical protein
VSEGVTARGAKGVGVFWMEECDAREENPGRNTLEGQTRMEIEGRNTLLHPSVSIFNSILRLLRTFILEITESYVGFIKSFESSMCIK